VSLPGGFPGPKGPLPGKEEPPDATLATPEPNRTERQTLKLPPEKKTSEKKSAKEKKQDEADKEEALSRNTKSGKNPMGGTKSDLHSLVKGQGATTVGAGGSAPGGFSSELQLDIENFEFSYYLVAVRNKVSSNWSPPAGLSASVKAMRTVVFFRIQRDGSIADVTVESPSTVAFFDQSALRAVLRSESFPPLPRGFADNSLGVHFGFEYVQ
jgi:TonB family protein